MTQICNLSDLKQGVQFNIVASQVDLRQQDTSPFIRSLVVSTIGNTEEDTKLTLLVTDGFGNITPLTGTTVFTYQGIKDPTVGRGIAIGDPNNDAAAKNSFVQGTGNAAHPGSQDQTVLGHYANPGIGDLFVVGNGKPERHSNVFKITERSVIIPNDLFVDGNVYLSENGKYLRFADDVSSVNGVLLITNSAFITECELLRTENDKLYYKFDFAGDNPFAEDDYLLIQYNRDERRKAILRCIGIDATSIEAELVYGEIIEDECVGYSLIRIGNVTNEDRQEFIKIDPNNGGTIDFVNVQNKLLEPVSDLSYYTNTRLGNLNNVEYGDHTLSGMGLYSENAYLSGAIHQADNRWALNPDGSGHVANGNISWDADGNVSISYNVKTVPDVIMSYLDGMAYLTYNWHNIAITNDELLAEYGRFLEVYDQTTNELKKVQTDFAQLQLSYNGLYGLVSRNTQEFNKYLDELGKNVNSVREQYLEVIARCDKLSTKITDNEAYYDAVTNDLLLLRQRMSQFEQTAEGISMQVSELIKQINDGNGRLEKDVAELQVRADKIEGRVASEQAQLDQFGNRIGITETNVGKVTQTAKELSSKYGAIKQLFGGLADGKEWDYKDNDEPVPNAENFYDPSEFKFEYDVYVDSSLVQSSEFYSPQVYLKAGTQLCASFYCSYKLSAENPYIEVFSSPNNYDYSYLLVSETTGNHLTDLVRNDPYSKNTRYYVTYETPTDANYVFGFPKSALRQDDETVSFYTFFKPMLEYGSEPTDFFKNESLISQTSSHIAMMVRDSYEGAMSYVEQTYYHVLTYVENTYHNAISYVEQTANGIYTYIDNEVYDDINGIRTNVNTLSQTAEELSSRYGSIKQIFGGLVNGKDWGYKTGPNSYWKNASEFYSGVQQFKFSFVNNDYTVTATELLSTQFYLKPGSTICVSFYNENDLTGTTINLYSYEEECAYSYQVAQLGRRENTDGQYILRHISEENRYYAPIEITNNDEGRYYVVGFPKVVNDGGTIISSITKPQCEYGTTPTEFCKEESLISQTANHITMMVRNSYEGACGYIGLTYDRLFTYISNTYSGLSAYIDVTYNNISNRVTALEGRGSNIYKYEAYAKKNWNEDQYKGAIITDKNELYVMKKDNEDAAGDFSNTPDSTYTYFGLYYSSTSLINATDYDERHIPARYFWQYIGGYDFDSNTYWICPNTEIYYCDHDTSASHGNYARKLDLKYTAFVRDKNGEITELILDGNPKVDAKIEARIDNNVENPLKPLEYVSNMFSYNNVVSNVFNYQDHYASNAYISCYLKINGDSTYTFLHGQTLPLKFSYGAQMNVSYDFAELWANNDQGSFGQLRVQADKISSTVNNINGNLLYKTPWSSYYNNSYMFRSSNGLNINNICNSNILLTYSKSNDVGQNGEIKISMVANDSFNNGLNVKISYQNTGTGNISYNISYATTFTLIDGSGSQFNQVVINEAKKCALLHFDDIPRSVIITSSYINNCEVIYFWEKIDEPQQGDNKYHKERLYVDEYPIIKQSIQNITGVELLNIKYVNNNTPNDICINKNIIPPLKQYTFSCTIDSLKKLNTNTKLTFSITNTNKCKTWYYNDSINDIFVNNQLSYTFMVPDDDQDHKIKLSIIGGDNDSRVSNLISEITLSKLQINIGDTVLPYQTKGIVNSLIEQTADEISSTVNDTINDKFSKIIQSPDEIKMTVTDALGETGLDITSGKNTFTGDVLATDFTVISNKETKNRVLSLTTYYKFQDEHKIFDTVSGQYVPMYDNVPALADDDPLLILYTESGLKFLTFENLNIRSGQTINYVFKRGYSNFQNVGFNTAAYVGFKTATTPNININGTSISYSITPSNTSSIKVTALKQDSLFPVSSKPFTLTNKAQVLNKLVRSSSFNWNFKNGYNWNSVSNDYYIYHNGVQYSQCDTSLSSVFDNFDVSAPELINDNRDIIKVQPIEYSWSGLTAIQYLRSTFDINNSSGPYQIIGNSLHKRIYSWDSRDFYLNLENPRIIRYDKGNIEEGVFKPSVCYLFVYVKCVPAINNVTEMLLEISELGFSIPDISGNSISINLDNLLNSNSLKVHTSHEKFNNISNKYYIFAQPSQIGVNEITTNKLNFLCNIFKSFRNEGSYDTSTNILTVNWEGLNGYVANIYMDIGNS